MMNAYDKVYLEKARTALGRMRYALLNMRRMAGEHHLL